MTYRRLRASALIGLGLLAGCQTYHAIRSNLSSDSPTTCPGAAILVDTASLPAFDPAKGTDPSSVIYKVALTDVKTTCFFDKKEKSADARLQFKFHAVRPPGGAEAHYRVPYFVAVTTGEDIPDKKNYWLNVAFDAGATEVDGDGVIQSTIVPVPKDKQIYDYNLILGFQLTKAQLDYNAKMGQYMP